jgi:hypothetical protein
VSKASFAHREDPKKPTPASIARAYLQDGIVGAKEGSPPPPALIAAHPAEEESEDETLAMIADLAPEPAAAAKRRAEKEKPLSPTKRKRGGDDDDDEATPPTRKLRSQTGKEAEKADAKGKGKGKEVIPAGGKKNAKAGPSKNKGKGVAPPVEEDEGEFSFVVSSLRTSLTLHISILESDQELRAQPGDDDNVRSDKSLARAIKRSNRVNPAGASSSNPLNIDPTGSEEPATKSASAADVQQEENKAEVAQRLFEEGIVASNKSNPVGATPTTPLPFDQPDAPSSSS